MIDKNIFPDYLLINDLPGYKKGCIFSMGENYIYYVSSNPEKFDDNGIVYDFKEGWVKLDSNEEFIPHKDSLLRFNINQMESNPSWFMKIDKQVNRDLKIEEICQ